MGWSEFLLGDCCVEVEALKEDFPFWRGGEGKVKLKMPRFVAMVGFQAGLWVYLWHWMTPH